MMEKRLVELETKLAYQEDTLLTLNDVVSQQQQRIDQLEATLKLLVARVQRLSALAEATDPMVQEKPPHY